MSAAREGSASLMREDREGIEVAIFRHTHKREHIGYGAETMAGHSGSDVPLGHAKGSISRGGASEGAVCIRSSGRSRPCVQWGCRV